MNKAEWILIDTETTGFAPSIFVVELAAQRMRGWEPVGEAFRRLLNQDTQIPLEASRVHGYAREILERDGEPPAVVYRDFAAYAGDLPIVAYNNEYDLEQVLKPEWSRLGLKPIGTLGFCALRLAQRLLDPVPAGNCKLQTLRQFYRLPERGAHTGLGDVQTVCDLLAHVLRPIAESRGLNSWEDICAYAGGEWYPSRIAFGKFKGRDFHDARSDEDLREWIDWLASSSNALSVRMGQWYQKQIKLPEAQSDAAFTVGSAGVGDSDVENPSISELSGTGIVVYINTKIDQLRKLISAARTRLAEIEASYTRERHVVDVMKGRIFRLLRKEFEARDRLRLVVEYRRKYIKILLAAGEQEAAEVASDFEKAKEQSKANYEEAERSAENQRDLSAEEELELKTLWKKLVLIYHPDRFSQESDKCETYGKLTGIINQARESGDLELLREIASDPNAFILRNGWAALDFSDSIDIKTLQKLYDTLQIEILDTLELLDELHESPDWELHELSAKQPDLLTSVASEQAKAISAEIAELEREAARLKSEIAELAGQDAPRAI